MEKKPNIPKYKIAIVTWIAITSLLIPYNLFIAPYLQEIAIIPRTLMVSTFLVIIMTYFWLPFIHKILSKWLYNSQNFNS